MTLVIKKTVKLDFLGEEYKDSYLVFKSIPLKDFAQLQKDIGEIGEDGIKSIQFISDQLNKYFISGKAVDEKGELTEVKAEDLQDLDQETVVRCFETLTGQNINKDQDFLEVKSSKPSLTTADPPSNS